MKTFTNTAQINKKKVKLSPVMSFIMQIITTLLGSVAMISSFALMGVNLLSLFITFS